MFALRALVNSSLASLIVLGLALYSTCSAGGAGGTITCPDGTVVSNPPGICPEKKESAVSQPGVTGNTVSGTTTDIGGTIGSVLGSSLGGGGFGGTGPSGTNTTSMEPGMNRFALGSGETGAAAAAGGTKWNAWLAYSRSNVGYSFQPLQSGGNVDVVLGGIDYTFGSNLIAGIALSDERTRVTTSFNGGSIRASGNTVAPYLGWRINNNWMLDATLGLGTTNLSFTDNSGAASVTGANKDKRSIASLGLAYNHTMGRWLLTAKGSLLSIEDRFSAFTQSNNTAVNGSTTRTAQARIGGQAMFNAGSFVPYLGVTYINDIQRPNQAPVGGQTAANDRDGWQLRGGINFRSSGALYGGVQVSSEVGRSQVKNEQILFNAGIRF